jgi:hypothetical protein
VQAPVRAATAEWQLPPDAGLEVGVASFHGLWLKLPAQLNVWMLLQL